jgi:hypothetical protein
MSEGGLDWLPNEGIRLTRAELARTIRSLRALIDGTEPDGPNRAHAVTIAHAIADAIEREE